MLSIITFTLIFGFSGLAQSTPISAEEYDKAFQYALTETNQRFPFVHTFKSQTYMDGLLVSYSVDVAERQASNVEKQTFTTVENGKKTVSYQLRTGYGNKVFCSSDGKSWIGPQVNECPRSIRIYQPEPPTMSEYSLEMKTVDGKKLRAYRKFEVFGTEPSIQTFSEEIALIASDGTFVSTTQTMGKVASKVIDTKLTNTWDLKAKFPPITVPKNVKPPTGKKQTITLIGKYRPRTAFPKLSHYEINGCYKAGRRSLDRLDPQNAQGCSPRNFPRNSGLCAKVI